MAPEAQGLSQAHLENTLLDPLTIQLCTSSPTSNCLMIYEFAQARLTRIESAGENKGVEFTFGVLARTFQTPTGDVLFVFNNGP